MSPVNLCRYCLELIWYGVCLSVLGVSPAGLPAVLGFDQKNQAGLSDVSPTAFLVPNLGSDWTVGLGSSIVLPAGDGTSIVARFQQVQPFWLLSSRPVDCWCSNAQYLLLCGRPRER